MGHAARKARKKAGLKFESKPAKVATPPEERSYVTGSVPGPGGTKFESYSKPRSEKKIKRFLDRFTPASVTTE
jgi:hypothetical protein